MHTGQAVRFGIFLKYILRLLSDGSVEFKIYGCRYHFRLFQVELDTLGTKHFEIGSVVTKLQPLECIIHICIIWQPKG